MCHNTIEPETVTNILDIGFKTATILIAAFNIYYVYKIATITTKKSSEENEKDRRINLLKTLVLDHHLDFFYKKFEEIEEQLKKLERDGLSDNEKSVIDSNVIGFQIELRRGFYDYLLAIDHSLYNSIIELSDKYQEKITNSVFDAGVNLSHQPKFEELILEPLTRAKTEIIKKLFSYRGD